MSLEFLFIDRKEVTKPRNKTKEFLFNLVFFIVLPVLPLFKLCKKIAKCCCRKKPTSEDETKRKTEEASDNEKQGPEVDILKEGDILKDGRLRSTENMTGIKRGHSTDSSRSSLVIKKSKHGSKDNIVSAGNRRASTGRHGTEGGMETRNSYRKASVQEKPELLVSLYIVCYTPFLSTPSHQIPFQVRLFHSITYYISFYACHHFYSITFDFIPSHCTPSIPFYSIQFILFCYDSTPFHSTHNLFYLSITFHPNSVLSILFHSILIRKS